MVNSTSKDIEELIAEGQKFTYQNFAATWGSYGYPASFKPEYIAWAVSAQTILESHFGISSAVVQAFSKGRETSVLGNPEHHFIQARNRMLGALQAALKLILSTEKGEFSIEKPRTITNNKVFIVHGHDEAIKEQLDSFLRGIGIETIILHKQADEGQTIIEKFEKHSDVGYAFILLTPDDIGYDYVEETKMDSQRNKNLRARQNVIFEFGYFVGKLGRSRVCCLHKESLELPTDISGVIYKPLVKSVEEVGIAIIRDLKAAGYSVKI